MYGGHTLTVYPDRIVPTVRVPTGSSCTFDVMCSSVYEQKGSLQTTMWSMAWYWLVGHAMVYSLYKQIFAAAQVRTSVADCPCA